MFSRLSRRFHRSNYRALADRSVWLTIFRSLKRSRKDARARKHLFALAAAIGLLILLIAGCFTYLLFVIGTGAWFFIPVVIPVMWWIRRGARREFAPMDIAPRPELLSTGSLHDSRRLVPYFSKLALLYAVLVDRAGSESYLKQKELPVNSEVITRRKHLELLKSAGIWDSLSPGDREAIMLPDGAWDWSRINKAAAGVEPIRVLRWMLRLEFCLPLIALQISSDFSMAQELVKNPEKLLGATDIVDIDAVRSANEQARMILLRCFAESVSRGYLVPKRTDMIAWANEISSSLHGRQNEDFLIGDKLVSEASETQLSWTLAVAKIRHQFLNWAEPIMAGRQPLPESFDSVFADPPFSEAQPAIESNAEPSMH